MRKAEGEGDAECENTGVVVGGAIANASVLVIMAENKATIRAKRKRETLVLADIVSLSSLETKNCGYGSRTSDI
jgi:hypothetical protein